MFEISWEVCNKVGGIHTVLESKSFEVAKHFQNYYTIGPFRGKNQREFEEDLNPPKEFLQATKHLASKGILLHFGTWTCGAKPRAILVEYLGHSAQTNSIKAKLWELYSIDSLGTSWYDVDEVLLWSWCCGLALESIMSFKESSDSFLIHAHEWMAGGALLCLFPLQKNKENFRTIFTTHATMLGRSLAGNGKSLYEMKASIDPDQSAKELGVLTKHQIEKVLAQRSDCFTTVSDFTGEEASIFYGKAPDLILYNGFSTKELTHSFDEALHLHKENKEKILAKLSTLFTKNQQIHLDNIKLFYISGRNEFRNKGVDITIEALAQLNEHLKEKEGDTQVIVLFLIMVGSYPLSPCVKENLEKKTTASKPFQFSLYAPLSTHDIPLDNEIISSLREHSLLNHVSDKVKVLLTPVILDSEDGFYNMDYYSVISATNLGIFPSYYEPWGYTPVESLTYACPTITSDLSGFGKYVEKNIPESSSISVLEREGKTESESRENLTQVFEEFLEKNEIEELALQKESFELSRNFDWSAFYHFYLKAYDKDNTDSSERT